MANIYITKKEEELLLIISHDLGLPINETTRAALGLFRGFIENYYFTPVQRANKILSRNPMPVQYPELDKHNKTKINRLLKVANDIST